jgi:hypothetical protein
LIDLLLLAAERPADVAAAFSRTSALPSPRSAAVFVELGGVGLGPEGDVGARAGLAVAVGLERSRRDRGLSLHLAVRRLSEIQVAVERGNLEVDELDAAVGVRAIRRWGRFVAGAGLDLGARFFAVQGRSAGGRTDSAFSLVPTVGIGAESRVSLTRRLELRLSLGVEYDLVRQRFLLLEEPAADLGRWRSVGGVSIVWAWR